MIDRTDIEGVSFKTDIVRWKLTVFGWHFATVYTG